MYSLAAVYRSLACRYCRVQIGKDRPPGKLALRHHPFITGASRFSPAPSNIPATSRATHVRHVHDAMPNNRKTVARGRCACRARASIHTYDAVLTRSQAQSVSPPTTPSLRRPAEKPVAGVYSREHMMRVFHLPIGEACVELEKLERRIPSCQVRRCRRQRDDDLRHTFC